jgi:hypothetical protein
MALTVAVTLLRDVPWSSKGVEQAHGSIASIHKLHKNYGADTLCCRTMLHQARRLFVPSAEVLAPEKSRQQIDKLQWSSKRRVSARNMFFMDMMLEIQHGLGGTAAYSNVKTSIVMAKSNALCNLLDPVAELRYTERAEEYPYEKHKLLAVDLVRS